MNERYFDGVPEGYFTKKMYTVADLEKAVLTERKACAKVCDDIAKCCFVENPARKVVESIAAAIRARSDKE